MYNNPNANPYHTLNTNTPVIWDKTGEAKKVSAEIQVQKRKRTIERLRNKDC